MLKLTFDCCTQFLLLSYFSFDNKINVCFAVSIFFLLLIYCFCFYPITYIYNNKKGSNILLTKTKFQLNSFFFECFCIVFRNFVKSTIHAFFISNYNLQIFLLTVTDFIFLYFTIKMRNCFIHKFIAVFCILYNLTFFTFDLFFALNSNFQLEYF
jgi:hypothetical protein